MSNPIMSLLTLEAEFAAAVDRMDHDAVEDLSRRIAETHYAQNDVALLLQELAYRIILKRVHREAGLTSGTRKKNEQQGM